LRAALRRGGRAALHVVSIRARLIAALYDRMGAASERRISD
jgi:hypothetical protein